MPFSRSMNSMTPRKKILIAPRRMILWSCKHVFHWQWNYLFHLYTCVTQKMMDKEQELNANFGGPIGYPKFDPVDFPTNARRLAKTLLLACSTSSFVVLTLVHVQTLPADGADDEDEEVEDEDNHNITLWLLSLGILAKHLVLDDVYHCTVKDRVRGHIKDHHGRKRCLKKHLFLLCLGVGGQKQAKGRLRQWALQHWTKRPCGQCSAASWYCHTHEVRDKSHWRSWNNGRCGDRVGYGGRPKNSHRRPRLIHMIK